MAINLGPLSNATTAATSLSNLILVTPQLINQKNSVANTQGYQAQNAPSWKKDTRKLPPSILFNYEGEQAVSLQSDITDHYVENNTAIQDMIALKPVTITTSGFVGELNNVTPSFLQTVKILADKLVAVSAYAPQVSTSASLAYALAFQLYQVANNTKNAAVSSWSTINGDTGTTVIDGSTQVNDQGVIAGAFKNQTQQQVYFQQFYGYWANRNLFTIQTPWAIFQDMAIQSMRSVQDHETRMITDFEITFKLIRSAQSLTAQGKQYSDNSNFQGRLNAQGASPVDLGNSVVDTGQSTFPADPTAGVA